jgi:hypothetical protein
MKLIIDVPEESYKYIKTISDLGLGVFAKAIKNGTPLDSNSERAEVQAYFDGEAYGWEQGRKALIDDVKAEIQDLYVGYRHGYEIMADVLRIIDNIGKAESEDK